MAAVISIRIETSGGLDAVKKDVQDLGNTAKDSGSGFSALQEIGVGALRAIGEAVTGFALKGFSMLAGAVQDGIADAQNNAKIQAQTAAVLKSTGDAAGVSAQHVADYASSLSDAAGQSLFGDDQVQQSTNLLLTFTNIKGASLDAATAISVDMAQALGGAPKDAAIQLGKALNDPVKGITALTRVGVTFTDEQKAQIQAMQESGDMAGAQTVILNELNKEFGGSAKAAADATGGWSEFNGRMGEAKEALGAAVLPLLTQLAGVLLDTVVPAIEGLAAQFGPFVASLQPVIASVTGFIQELIASFANTSPLDTFSAATSTLAAFWSTQLQPALQAVWTVLQTQVWPILQDLATAVFPLVGAAVQVLTGLWNDVLLPSLSGLWALLTTVVLPVIAALAGWLADNLPGAIQATADFLTNTLFPILHAVYDFIAINVIPILAMVAEWLITNVPVAIQMASDFFNNVLVPALNSVWSFIEMNILPIFATLWGWLQTTIPAALQLLAGVWNTVLLPAINAVWAFITNFLIPLFNALIAVNMAALNLAIRTLTAIWNTELLPAITGIWKFIQDSLGPIFDWFTVTILGPLEKTIHDIAFFILGTLTPWLQALGKEVSGPLAGAFQHMQNIADGAVSGLRNIGSAVQSVISWLSELAAKIASIGIPDWLEGHSPPPMADWFSYIGAAVGALNAQLPELQAQLTASIGPQGQSISNTASTRSFSYSPTIYSSGGTDMPMDMALASSLASV